MFDSHPPSRSPHWLVDADLNVAAGIKRRAPSLLPAFEPSSSPPRFKRRKSRPSAAAIHEDDENLYPAAPILPSSPPQPVVAPRPTLQRTQSTLSERAPLSDVPSITLPENGDEILLGRSSKSSHVGLSANRLISRVHIRAKYTHTKEGKPKVEVTCTGWNGVTIHCQGQAWELQKGDVFNSETEHAEIMLDIQDSRVLLAWPGAPPPQQENQLAPEPNARARVERSRSPSPGRWADENADPRVPTRRLTPVSPTPVRRASAAVASGNAAALANQSMSETFLEIYEDDEEERDVNASKFTDAHSEDEQEQEEEGEEEEPELPPPPILNSAAIFSFTEDDDSCLPPFKDSGFESDMVLPPMARFSTADSLRSTPSSRYNRGSSLARNLYEASSPIVPFRRSTISQTRSPSISPTKANTIQNHLTNQLAFSRIATVPLSDLLRNLPADLARTVTKEKLCKVLEKIECIGEVKRHGKDAAGKPLESEFYYVLEKDQDEGRKLAVSGRRGVRNCRKTHKVGFGFGFGIYSLYLGMDLLTGAGGVRGVAILLEEAKDKDQLEA